MSPKQAKLPGFTEAQHDEIEAAIDGYQGAKDRLDAANVPLKEDVLRATEALVDVMRKYKRKDIIIEGRQVTVLDLVKIKVKGRRTAKREEGE